MLGEARVAFADEDFAFIDDLLATLGAEKSGEASGKTPSLESRPLSRTSDALEAKEDVVPTLELSELMVEPAPLGNGVETETWGSLINRFCEDGDESIVDVLLDKFLRSGCDAGSLIDAVGHGAMMDTPAPARTDRHGRLNLNLQSLEHRTAQDLENQRFQAWDELLKTARELVDSKLSSRSSSRSNSPVPLQGWQTPPLHVHGAEGRGLNACCGDSQCCDLGATCSTGTGGLPDRSCCSRTPDVCGAMLTELSEVDNYTALRSFMWSFLISVRQRAMEGRPCDPSMFETMEIKGSRHWKEFNDDNLSVWSCQSVNTLCLDC